MRPQLVVSIGLAIAVYVGIGVEARQSTLQADPRLSSGTGIIRGQVVEAGSAQPVANAVVSISLDGGRHRRSVTTTSEGVFVFENAPAGRFFISGTKTGYLVGSYGTTTLFGGGGISYFELADGEAARDVVLLAWKRAAVSGRVFDVAGQPDSNAVVQLKRVTRTSGRRYLTGFPLPVTADGDGRYRFPSVYPGEYVIAVVSFAPYGMNPASRAAAAVAARDFPTVFYPGTTSVDDATVVTIESGVPETTGLDIYPRSTATSSVAGRVVGLPAGSRNVEVDLLSTSPGTIVSDLPMARTPVLADGAFRFPRVPPGRYDIRVRLLPQPPYGEGAVTQWSIGGGLSISGGGMGMPLAPMSDDPTFWAVVPVTVGTTHLDGIDVALSEGGRIRGMVVFDGTAPRPAAESLTSVGLFVASARGEDLPRFQVARIEADGTFATVGLPPGRYSLRASPTGANLDWPYSWSLESTTVDGQAVSGIDVGTGDRTGVRLVFTDTPAGLSGSVRDESGSRRPQAFIYVFPTDRSAWTQPGSFPPSLRILRSSRQGAYDADLPPGEYFVASTLVAPASGPNLEALAARALTVRLGRGERRGLDLVGR